MAGRLTTHVLDTANGVPAEGMAIVLSDGEGKTLASATTNHDGRLDGPILSDEAFVEGRYALAFSVAAYFRARGTALPDPPFLEEVVVQFGIADRAAHYHVPLLVSPYGYSTYRGS
ncbi:MAG: hydroxyisourate hydrolase [Pseudomonadota bacterium]